VVAIDKHDIHRAQVLAAEAIAQLGHARHRVHPWLAAEDGEYIPGDGVANDDGVDVVRFDVLAPLFPVLCELLVALILVEVVFVGRSLRGCRAVVVIRVPGWWLV
jgi:hypothetical protein